MKHSNTKNPPQHTKKLKFIHKTAARVCPWCCLEHDSRSCIGQDKQGHIYINQLRCTFGRIWNLYYKNSDLKLIWRGCIQCRRSHLNHFRIIRQDWRPRSWGHTVFSLLAYTPHSSLNPSTCESKVHGPPMIYSILEIGFKSDIYSHGFDFLCIYCNIKSKYTWIWRRSYQSGHKFF